MKDYNEMAESVLKRRDQYNIERRTAMNKMRKSVMVVGAVCLCFVVVLGVKLMNGNKKDIPNPQLVQIANPFMKVETVEEMEQYLDFEVPVLEKEIESMSVLVENSYPSMGQINYADGTMFRVKYGEGDISGVYGGTIEETKEISDATVQYCKYADITYAVWEQDGFTFSYTYENIAEVEEIIRAFQ